MDSKKLLTIPQAIEYQRREYGHVAYGRDSLYALAKSGAVLVVKVGERKLFFPTAALDRLLTGEAGAV